MNRIYSIVSRGS